MMKKTQISILLLAAMLLASCGEAAAPGADDTTSAGDTTAPEVTTAVDPARVSNLPDKYDLGGYEFRVLKQAQDKIAWSLQTFGVSEENGEVLNDAIYARNQAMMEKYNFTMKEIEIDTYPHSTVRSSVMAGDDEYDAAFIAITHDRSPFDGTYFNVYDLPHLELDKVWWNHAMQEALTFGGSLYFLSGDLIVSDDDGLQINIYNKALGEDFKFENLYDVVNEGRWTIDYKKKLLTDVSADLNADGKMDTDDRMPMFYANNAAGAPYFASANVQLFTPEGDGLVFTGENERAHALFEKMQAILSDKKYSYEWSQITEALPLDVMVAMFDTKQALFIDGALNFVRRSLRNMDADFSILPMPKLDEAQDTYYGYSNSAMTYLMVPATIGDPDKVGFILEALCAASGKITDTYYRTCIEGKYVRDAESIDMMNIAAANIVYDMGFLYNWGSLGNSIQNAMMNGGGYASLIASGKEAAIAAMEDYLEQIAG